MKHLLFILLLLCPMVVFGQGRSTPADYGFDFFEKHANSGHLRDTIINSRRVGYTEVQRFCGHFTYYAVCVGDVGDLCNKPLLKMDATSKKGYRLADVVLTRGKQLSHMVDYVVGISHNATISALANRKGELLALKWEYQKKEDNAPSLEACAKLFDTLSKLKIYPVWDEVITDGSLSEQDNLALFFVPFTKRTTKEEFVKIYNDNLAIVREDHNFRSFIESASDAVALERVVDFIGTTVDISSNDRMRLRAALEEILKEPKLVSNNNVDDWCRYCKGVIRTADAKYPVALQGRVVNSAIEQVLSAQEQKEFYDAYRSYFLKMTTALSAMENGFYFGIFAKEDEILVRQYGQEYLYELKEYLLKNNENYK